MFVCVITQNEQVIEESRVGAGDSDSCQQSFILNQDDRLQMLLSMTRDARQGVEELEMIMRQPLTS